jgi:FkbM family methyltransferase
MPYTRLHRYDIEYLDEKEYHSLKREIFTHHCYAIELSDPKRTQEVLIFDAGAHIGLSTIYFAEQFPEAIIVALEPNPEVFPILEQNLSSNGFHHAHPLPVALAPKYGPIRFFVPDENQAWTSNSSTQSRGWNGEQRLQPIFAEGRTPSEILTYGRDLAQKQGWTHPTVIWKLDVEGAEKELLPLVLALKPDVLLVELHGLDTDARALTKLFEKSGYRLAEELEHRRQLQIATAYLE